MRLNLSLHYHHQNDWGVGGGRVRGRLNLTSHCHHQNDCSVKIGKREENRKRNQTEDLLRASRATPYR